MKLAKAVMYPAFGVIQLIVVSNKTYAGILCLALIGLGVLNAFSYAKTKGATPEPPTGEKR